MPYDQIKDNDSCTIIQKAICLTRDILSDCGDMPGTTYYDPTTSTRTPLQDIEVIVGHTNFTPKEHTVVDLKRGGDDVDIWVSSNDGYSISKAIYHWFEKKKDKMSDNNRIRVRSMFETNSKLTATQKRKQALDMKSSDAVVFRYTTKTIGIQKICAFSVESARNVVVSE